MLNNRIFDGGEPKTKTTSIVTNGNAVNGNLKEEGENTEYKFTLPDDEDGIVYQCHLCSFTTTTLSSSGPHHFSSVRPARFPSNDFRKSEICHIIDI